MAVRSSGGEKLIYANPKRDTILLNLRISSIPGNERDFGNSKTLSYFMDRLQGTVIEDLAICFLWWPFIEAHEGIAKVLCRFKELKRLTIVGGSFRSEPLEKRTFDGPVDPKKPLYLELRAETSAILEMTKHLDPSWKTPHREDLYYPRTR
jgi:hypothetical protein